jgi:hypothetical protein
MVIRPQFYWRDSFGGGEAWSLRGLTGKNCSVVSKKTDSVSTQASCRGQSCSEALLAFGSWRRAVAKSGWSCCQKWGSATPGTD